MTATDGTLAAMRVLTPPVRDARSVPWTAAEIGSVKREPAPTFVSPQTDGSQMWRHNRLAKRGLPNYAAHEMAGHSYRHIQKGTVPRNDPNHQERREADGIKKSRARNQNIAGTRVLGGIRDAKGILEESGYSDTSMLPEPIY